MIYGLSKRECGILLAALRNWQDVSGDNVVNITEIICHWGYIPGRPTAGRRVRFKKGEVDSSVILRRDSQYYKKFEHLLGQEATVMSGVVGQGVYGPLVSVYFDAGYRLALYEDEMEDIE